MLNELKIDRAKPALLGEQICSQIKEMINSGRLTESQKLPTLREFEKGLGVGICTVQKAFVQLEKEKFISKRPHLGIFVQPESERKPFPIEIPSATSNTNEKLKDLCVAIVTDKVSAANRRNLTVIETFESAISSRQGKTFLIDIPRNGLPIDKLKELLGDANTIFYIGYGEEANDFFVRQLLSLKLPLATYSYKGNVKVSGTLIDWEWAVRELMEHLISLGHKKIAMASFYLHEQENFPWMVERERAFLDLAAFHYLPIDENDVYKEAFYEGGPSDQGLNVGEKVGEKIFSSHKNYTAIFAINDEFAEGVSRAARKRGLRIPEDLSITGFDNDPLAIAQGLTTIAHPLEEDGKAIADILAELYLNPTEDKINQVINKPRLIARKSTRKLSKQLTVEENKCAV